MKVVYAAADLQSGPRPVCAAIGVFDGVHLGHQHVLRQMLDDAARCNAVSTVITFDKHPNAVVALARVPPLIYPLAKKLKVIASLGIQAAYIIRFDKAFSEIHAETFVRDLARDFGKIKSLCVGDGFMFGAKRSGNIDLLHRMGAELGFALHAMQDLELAGNSVSSTRIRETIRAGDFFAAQSMLGRPYALCGAVIEGQRLGQKLGFPTANVDTTGLVVPPNGVYVAEIHIDGKQHHAAVNIGHRPTVQSADPQLHVEAHILDFSGNLYGRTVELVFVKKLRDEKKFSNVDALREQIGKDVEAVRLAAATR